MRKELLKLYQEYLKYLIDIGEEFKKKYGLYPEESFAGFMEWLEKKSK
jgi:hypothetical protein